MPLMARSNSRVAEVVDLTIDSDVESDHERNFSSHTAAVVSKEATSTLPRRSLRPEDLMPPTRKLIVSTPAPGNESSREAIHPANTKNGQARTSGVTGTATTSRTFRFVTAQTGMGHNASMRKGNVQTAKSVEQPKGSEHIAKRRKISTPSKEDVGDVGDVGGQPQSVAQNKRKQATQGGAATGASVTTARAFDPHTSMRADPSTMSTVPSVSHMKSALKSFGSDSSFINRFAAPAARPLILNNVPQQDTATGLPSPGLTTPESVTAMIVDVDDDLMEITQPLKHINNTSDQEQLLRSPPPRLPPRCSSAVDGDDGDSVASDLPVRQPKTRKAQRNSTPPGMDLTATTSAPNPVRPPINFDSGSATEKADHLLIFLKEVKKLKWADITKEFQKDIPGRTYVQLQSRYSTTINKRDRTQDPPTLNLPARFATEATIDWGAVHTSTEGPRCPRIQNGAAEPKASRAPRNTGVGRSRTVQYRRDDDASGSDSAPQRPKRQRAPPVNYTWPKLKTTEGGFNEEVDEEELDTNHTSNITALSRSESPMEKTLVASHARPAAKLRPLNIDFRLQNARFGLDTTNGIRSIQHEIVPYLSLSQRLALRNEGEECNWEPQSAQLWQGAVLHVDLSLAELQTVERVVAKTLPFAPQSQHSTYRRHLRTVLRDLPAPKIQKLAHRISRDVKSRDFDSISAFLEDAAAGKISDLPQVQRLAMIKQSTKFSNIQTSSVPSTVRKRELGQQCRRGWKTASKPLTYQLKNQLMDTLGPKSTWTGASSDIHTVAWSPDGQYFAAGAVAVTDTDSMQYNRPNVLLYGDTTNNRIHELGRHYVARPRTEVGANSTHAMFVSQDPKLYTTVSSVGFSPSGDLMYSAGYDKTVCIWDVTTGSQQPKIAHQLGHRAPVDILAVNPTYEGNIATATKRTTEKSIKLVSFRESSMHDEDWSRSVTNFASTKALNRPDLNMSANALKFDTTGQLLLAGFGANMREDSGLDTSGDICLWDVETQEALQVHGSSRNVFDVTFNPTPRNRGLFAVGCVANGNVNRGTRSVVRFYSMKLGPSLKFTCPLELECKAFDMNDVVWCPYDENLFAAGCTDGRSYVWDLRRPERVLYTLSHGSSLMPLQDGVPHERTDTGVRFLSWGQNARRLYSGSSDGVVKVWDVTQSHENVFIKDLITTNSGIMSGAFTTDFSQLVVGEVNGTANVLEVGRDDFTLRDSDKLEYQHYLEGHIDEELEDDLGAPVGPPTPSDLAAAESRLWLNSGELRLAPMGGLPKQQVIQGPNYQGPYDQADDAQSLRDQAFVFQRTMAEPQSLQCQLRHCKDNINVTTYEEVGDSGRSRDRIPNELRRQWLDETPRTVSGKTKCTECGRPAFFSTDSDTETLCEQCAFSCFNCGSACDEDYSIYNTTRGCGHCFGLWEIGALGYECLRVPDWNSYPNSTPALVNYEMELQVVQKEDEDASFGDEVNALSDYYFGLAIDRPEIPPL